MKRQRTRFRRYVDDESEYFLKRADFHIPLQARRGREKFNSFIFKLSNALFRLLNCNLTAELNSKTEILVLTRQHRTHVNMS